MRRLLILASFFWGGYALGQNSPAVDFLHAGISIEIDTLDQAIRGRVAYDFEVHSKIDSVAIDAVGMTFNNVLLHGHKVKYHYDGKRLYLDRRFKAGRHYDLTLEYVVHPSQTVYFVGWGDSLPGNNQVWTQGQGKYSSHWVPSFDDMNEKVVFDLNITFDRAYEVAANGRLVKTSLSGNQKTWQFEMKHPMSSYLLAFAIGKYRNVTRRSGSGVPLIMYFEPEDSLKVEPTYRYSERIFDFLEQKIGVPYPWQVYRQVPVRDFLYAGMENSACTLFSEGYMIDSVAFKDRNYVNINAHELAHQWFGDLVTEQSGRHHWLHEGFATYFAYLAEKDIFGEEHYYWQLYETALALARMSDEGGGEALTDPGAGSLTFYEKGAWAIFALRERIGQQAFTRGIRSFLTKHAYGNATVSDLLSVLEASSGTSLEGFRQEWLDGTEFPYSEAIGYLKNSCASLRAFLELQGELTADAGSGGPIIRKYWGQVNSARWKEAVVRAYFRSIPQDLIGEVLSGHDLKVRQAVAEETVQIPAALKTGYESLLSDQSYVTREAALYKLWVYFDEDRARYLDRCRDIQGLPNRNLRMLWLSLAVLTPNYDVDRKQEYFKELSGYTSPKYGFETRQLAFQYLEQAFPFPDASLKDLIRATVHPSWQFRKFARSLLDELLQKVEYRTRLEKITKQLKVSDLRYINQKLMTE